MSNDHISIKNYHFPMTNWGLNNQNSIDSIVNSKQFQLTKLFLIN